MVSHPKDAPEPIPESTRTPARIPVGISACLLGEPVRYDGAHKRSDYCHDVLGALFELCPVCPEMQVGLGAPRTIIRLVERGVTNVRAIQQTQPLRDLTADLQGVADALLNRVPALCGMVLTEKSPSCGLHQVKTYHAQGALLHTHGRGLFAGRLAERLPHFPLEEAARLDNPLRQNSFIQRVYAWHDWHTVVLPHSPDSHAIDKQAVSQYWQRYRPWVSHCHAAACQPLEGAIAAHAMTLTLHAAVAFFHQLMTALEAPFRQ